MIETCRTYLETCLKNAGIKRVFTKLEDATRYQVFPYAQVIEDNQNLQYDGSLTARFEGPEEGERTFRRRIYYSMVDMVVKVVHRDLIQAEALREDLLASFERSILDADENAILVTARSAEPEEDTSLLQGRAAAYLDVCFEGGIYKDKTVKVYDLDVTLEVETEITQEV